MTMRFTIAPFMRVLARRGEMGTHAALSGLAKGDCYALRSAVVYCSTVMEVVAGFLARDLDH